MSKYRQSTRPISASISRRGFLASTLAAIGATATGVPLTAPTVPATLFRGYNASAMEAMDALYDRQVMMDSLRESFTKEFFVDPPVQRTNRLHGIEELLKESYKC